MLSYVVFEMEKLVYSLYARTYTTVCTIQRQRLSMLKQWTQNNQAHLAARIIMGQTDVTGRNAGDLLAIMECQPILNYTLTTTESCYASIPITYISEGHAYQRYLVPSTRDVILFDTPISCDRPVVLYLESTQGELFLWNGRDLRRRDVNYTTLQMIEHAINETHLRLIAAHVADTELESENIDLLEGMLTKANDVIMSIVHSTGDITAMDPNTFKHAAIGMAEMISTATQKLFNETINWIRKIITIVISIFLFLGLVYILYLTYSQIQKKKQEAHTTEILSQLTASTTQTT